MKIPRSMMNEIRQMNRASHPNTQCIIVVDDIPLIVSLVGALNKAYGKDEIPFFFVNDLKAAFDLLEKQAQGEA